MAGPAELLLASSFDETTLSLPFNVVSRRGEMLSIQFHADSWILHALIRHALIRKLFTGAYHREIEEIKTTDVLRTLARVLVS